jgi:DNA-binding transcriptional LysR family regulator
MTKAMVAAGEGVSIIPRLMLDPDPGDVVIKPVAGEGINRRIAAVRLPSHYLTPAVQEFLSMTRDAAGVTAHNPRRKSR